MTTTSSQSETFASYIQKSNLKELQTLLKELKQMRSMRKQAGKKLLSPSGVRVELPVGSERSSADNILKKLSLEKETDIIYIENPKLIAGIRIFIGDTLYDGSFATLTQKI